jgi:hypothetical protein
MPYCCAAQCTSRGHVTTITLVAMGLLLGSTPPPHPAYHRMPLTLAWVMSVRASAQPTVFFNSNTRNGDADTHSRTDGVHSTHTDTAPHSIQ